MAGTRYAPLPDEAADALLRDLAQEEDWRLTLPYVPDEKRGGALVLYALAKELADAPGRVSEAPLGMIRFQWWREAVAEVFGDAAVRRHPLTLALDGAFADHPRVRPHLDALIDGAEEALSPEAPKTPGAAVNLLLPLYGRLGTALSVWLTGDDARGAAIAHAQALAVAVRAAPEEGGASPAQGRGLPRLVDLVAAGPAAAAYAGPVAAHRRTLARLPADLVPAALPLALSAGYAAGRSPGPLAKRTRLFRTVLTGRF